MVRVPLRESIQAPVRPPQEFLQVRALVPGRERIVRRIRIGLLIRARILELAPVDAMCWATLLSLGLWLTGSLDGGLLGAWV
jgi:hypothetical protein